MRKLTALFAGLLIIGVLSGCGNQSEQVVLKFAYELPQSHPWGQGAERFKEIVEEESDGEIQVQLYGGGQLGDSGREVQESVAIGTIEMGLSSTPLEQMNPYQEIFSLPYIFLNREHAWASLDSEAGDMVGEHLLEYNLQHLAFWEDGFRQVTNSVRPIEMPEDFDGLRIRVPESPVRMATFSALGSNPLPMSFSEVFTALQQGTVHGQENPLPVIVNSSFYDVQPYLTLTNHVYSPASLFINEDTWQNLSAEHQHIIQTAAEAGRDLNRELNERDEIELVERLESEGMEVFELEDVEAFQEATQPVWEPVVEG
ncbi:DctP family TRAP transporter solute-binding subunit [Geomicrobium sp. JCM 19039]|uniref:DctP family TRAP transporter solute-binding subunit n=1 Tax=Geomicrobium sp. JCM 19039 TaxID=1460636 RepID=UPI00045F1F0C|nr:DctP family TRAP transporter solute-binding subunit [Geomicrobium sp. JCM 19039]GAK10672.1 TRAP-type C4-dicarboxylate transport system, periplasmic component [Geomicrobium sp. JCM 19039]